MAVTPKDEWLRGTNLAALYAVKTQAQAGGGAVIEEVIYDDSAYGNDFGASLVGVYWNPSAAVAHVATNAYTLQIIQYASDGTTQKAVLGTFDARTTDAAKFADVALVTAEVALAAGDKLTYKLTQTGSGLAAPIGTLFIVHEQASDEE